LNSEKFSKDTDPSGDGEGEGEVIEAGPFGVELLRWTRNAGKSAAVRASINRSFDGYTPIYVRVYSDLFEVKPSQLYLELERLPLDEASGEAVRAYAALREQVVEDLKDAAWNELHEAMDKASEEE
jgi:hypothetical protein